MRARLLGWLACQLFRAAFRVARRGARLRLIVQRYAGRMDVDFTSGPYQTGVICRETAP